MLLSNLNLLATAPDGVARLRELILTLAVQGKLVPQDANDEPASELLKRVAGSLPVRSAKGQKATVNDDEVPAPYELPNGWAWSRLGDIVENMGSGWSPACDEGQRSDPTQWAVLRTTAVQVNEYRAHEHKVVPLKLSPRPEIEVKDGDILITRAGPMNRVGISCWVNNTPPRLMLSDKIVRFHSIADEMLPAFIVLALNAGWTKSQIEDAKTGMAASQVNISQTDLRGFWLPVCSKAEQSRIVTRVEELMRLCDALEAKARLEATQHEQLVRTLLGTLTASTTPEELTDNWHRVATHFDLLLDRPEAVDALEQTILQLAVRGLLVPQDPQDEPASELLKKIRLEKVRLIAEGKIKRDKPLPPIAVDSYPCELPTGWAWMRMSDLGDFCGGKTPSTQRSTYWDGEIPWITPKDMKKPLLSDSEDKVTQAAVDDGLALIPPQSVLIVVRSGILRRTVPTALNAVETTINQDLKALVLVRPALAGYVQLVIRGFEGFILQNLTKIGTTVESMQFDAFAAQPFPLPPLTEQSRIVARVASLRALCADLRQRLTTARTQKALLAQALVGEVA